MDRLLARKYPGQPFEIVKEFDVLHHGWEGDGTGWIVKVAEKNILILTNHGSAYEADPNEIRELLVSYQVVIDETKAAYTLLTGDTI